MNTKQMISRYAPAAMVMILIFLISGTPSEQIPKLGAWDALWKKSGHVLGYGLLTLTLFRAVYQDKPKLQWIIFLVVLVFALSDEFHQSFVPGRNASFVDIGIDMLGTLWAGLAFWRSRLVQKIFGIGL